MLAGESLPREDDRVVVVLPAYKAAKTVVARVEDIPAGFDCDVVLVDDFSPDETLAAAKRLGIKTVRHEENLGYGANQKTCYRTAMDMGAGIVVMLHPDYQYDPRMVPVMVEVIRLGICDVVLGNRVRSRSEVLRSGMPLYKYVANRFLTVIENLVLGQNLGDFHSGFRAYTREALESIPFESNSNDFVFDSQFLAQAAYFGFRIGDVPVPCRYFKEASSINLVRSTKYGLLTLVTLVRFVLARMGLWRGSLFRGHEREGGKAP